MEEKEGVLTGWISYTLSKTERKITGINQGNWYNAKQDRTHDIAIVGVYTLNSRWSISSVFVYNTGDAVTFPTGKYSIQGQTIYQYASRNGNRMPSNHRMDLSVTYDKKRKNAFKNLGTSVYTMCMAEKTRIKLIFKMTQRTLVEHKLFKPLYLDGYLVSLINSNFNDA